MFSFVFLQFEPLLFLFTSTFLSVLYYLQIDDIENQKYNNLFNAKKEMVNYTIATKDSSEKDILIHLVPAFMVTGIIIGISSYYPSADKSYLSEVGYIIIFILIAIVLITFYIFNITKHSFNRIAILKQLNIVSIIASLIEFLLLRFWNPNIDKQFTLPLLIGTLCNIILHYLLDTKIFVPLENEFLVSYKEKPVEKKEDLVFSRQNQLEYLISEFNKVASDEPYAMMLDGKWGQGKTSLINALMNEDKDFCFVYVSVGYSVNLKAILDDIEKQIRNNFEKEGYYCEQKGDIYSYFKMMCKLSAATVDERIGKIYDVFANDRETIKATKDELNCFLKGFYAQTGKRIIIIIDDLERCHPSNIKSIFALLLETCKLDNCLTLLVCDYKRLLDTKAVSAEYLDKYINRKFSLTFIKPFDVFSQIIKKHLDSSTDIQDWETCYEDIEFIIDKVEEYAEDVKTAEAYSIDSEEFVFFKSYTVKLKENLNNMLSNPRTAKKIWILGIKKGYEILCESELRGGEYKDIRVPAVATIYGLLLYGLANTYDEIIRLKGINQYKKYYRSISDIYHRNDDMYDQYFDYVIFIRLLDNYMPKEVMALDWLLLLKDTTKLSEYKTDREIYNEQWRDVSARNIHNFELYIEFVEFDANTLIEMIDFLYENISYVSVQYLEKYYYVFINTYDEKNDENLDILFNCYGIFNQCCEQLISADEKHYANVVGIANEFKEYVYMICYSSIAEIVWVITLHSISVDRLHSTESFKNVRDKQTYLKFLRTLVIDADISGRRKNELLGITNRNAKYAHRGIKELTDSIVDVCITENKSYLTVESRERKILLSKLSKYFQFLDTIEHNSRNNIVSKRRTYSEPFEAFGDDPIQNTADMITILKRLNNSWDTISFETKFLNCDRVMKRLGQFSLVVVDRADGCSNKERIKLSILVELISKTYKLYKEMMSYRDFKKYAEVLFIIEAARKKVLTRPEKIRKEEGTFQESQNNKKA